MLSQIDIRYSVSETIADVKTLVPQIFYILSMVLTALFIFALRSYLASAGVSASLLSKQVIVDMIALLVPGAAALVAGYLLEKKGSKN